MENNDIYIHLCSTQSDNMFPDNTNTSFRISLPKTLSLTPKGGWTISLVDMKMPSLKSNYSPEYIAIYLDECQPIIHENGISPLLFKAYLSETDRGRLLVYPQQTIDIPLIRDSISILHFNLKDENGICPSFEKGPFFCTLRICKSGY